MAYNPFAPTSLAAPPGVPGPQTGAPGVPLPPTTLPVPVAPAPPPAGPAKVSIAQAAMQSAMNKRQGRVTLQNTSLKRPPVGEPPKSAQLSGSVAGSAPQVSSTAPLSVESGQKRRRWDSTEPVVAADSSLAIPTPPVAAASASVGDGLSKAGISSHPKDYEEQLRQQKEIQFLEARIRGMKGENSKLQSLESLYKERLKHYEEFGSSSDEEVLDKSDPNWEHKRRAREMRKTAKQALEVTKANHGKHFIGDFLPKEELEKFKKEVEAVRKGEAAVTEDFAANKLDSSNIGYGLLQKAGWSEGAGLGSTASGVTAPVNVGPVTTGAGVGTAPTHKAEATDDEFEEYRKRMMLAYRFRPNPMNNPRRAYY